MLVATFLGDQIEFPTHAMTCPDSCLDERWWKLGPEPQDCLFLGGDTTIYLEDDPTTKLHQPVTYRGMQAAFSIIILDEDFMGIPFRKQEEFAKRWRTSMAHDYQYMDLAGRSSIFLLSSSGCEKTWRSLTERTFSVVSSWSRGSAASSCWMPLLEECLF